MVVKQESNEPCEEFLEVWEKLTILQSKHRIEVHIFTNEWMSLTKELQELNSSHSISLQCIPGQAAKLLTIVMGHLEALVTSWFPRMLVCPSLYEHSVTYMACWKCYAEIGMPKTLTEGAYS